MAVMDWVPLQGYNELTLIPTGGTASLELMSDDRWTGGDIVGNIELQKRYKVKRIVGYWTCVQSDPQNPPAEGAFWMRIWPAFKQPASGAVEIPGILDGAQSPTAAGPANQKWWWERVCPVVDIDPIDEPWNRVNSFAHPFNFMCDIKPDMWMEGQQTPVVTLENNTDADVDFIHRWRMLAVAP